MYDYQPTELGDSAQHIFLSGYSGCDSCSWLPGKHGVPKRIPSTARNKYCTEPLLWYWMYSFWRPLLGRHFIFPRQDSRWEIQEWTAPPWLQVGDLNNKTTLTWDLWSGFFRTNSTSGMVYYTRTIPRITGHLWAPAPKKVKLTAPLSIDSEKHSFQQHFLWEAIPFCPVSFIQTPILVSKGYGSIPINTIFSGMKIHLPAILGFTRYQGFDPSP